ncbi:MAG: toxin co-regulated pilus biosynthesis Q family protein [Pseudomonadota bacterium]|uniref:toxin co-regulated pilus biosynthesis Q family protein n=1 Tax=Burkholderiaceae TaxID=119060 RepID=UPI0020170C1D|nr:toxin co-regulated pilus biosynthesis Q family protein [Burkholderia sp. 4M9327F10]
MRTVITCMVMLSVLGSGLSGRACAAGTPDAQHNEQVTLVGESRESPRVTTSGTNMALRNALRLVVPIDYSINLPNAGVWAATPVSWVAGHSLVQTLRDMLSGHPELAAQVDTDFQLVTVRYRQPFGADTVGTLPPTLTSASPDTTAANADAGGPAVVGGPVTSNVSAAPLVAPATATAHAATQTVARPASVPSSAATVHAGGDTGSVAPEQPRITSKDFAATGVAGSSGAAGMATQLERTADAPPAAAVAAAAAHGSPSPAHARTAATLAAPTPVAVPIAAAPVVPPPIWRIELSDRTVRAALTRWAQQAGWQLIWEAPVDFSVDAPAAVTGTFDEALQSVVSALAGSNAPVQAILYRGNKVLRIVEKGAS